LTKRLSVKPKLLKQLAAEEGALLAMRGANDNASGKSAAGNAPGKAKDSFQNFALKLGMGTNNAVSESTYGFNPVTRLRLVLEWIYRGSWIAGAAVDSVADDMTQAGIEIKSDLEPEDVEELEHLADELAIWPAIGETIKWGRLYGGAIGVYMIDGADYSTPLNIDKIGPNSFRGILPMDRWMVYPSLFDLVDTPGPNYGNPRYYQVVSDAPALPRLKIHYTRCFRVEGYRLPYWQRIQENLWGLSVLERLYDRLVAFDLTTTAGAQLAHKLSLRVLKIDSLRELIAADGEAEKVLLKFLELSKKLQTLEGMTIIDAKDDFSVHSQTTTDIQGLLVQFGQQISGALQIPLVRLFGQSPAGLNSTGDSDMRIYYEGIRKEQKTKLKTPVSTIYHLMAKSAGIHLDKRFGFEFMPLAQMTEMERAEMAERDIGGILAVKESGLISDATALGELRSAGRRTGRFTSISDEEIDAANQAPPAIGEGVGGGENPPPPAPVLKAADPIKGLVDAVSSLRPGTQRDAV
jgi:uncharacterized protein